jgi:hypothetical protein
MPTSFRRSASCLWNYRPLPKASTQSGPPGDNFGSSARGGMRITTPQIQKGAWRVSPVVYASTYGAAGGPGMGTRQ